MSCTQPGSSGNENAADDEDNDYFELNRSRNKRRKADVQGNEMEFDSNAYMSYDQIESENDEAIYEDDSSESDEELEYEEFNELFVNTENAEEWMRDGDFRKLSFEGEASLRIPPKGPDPYNFFELLLDDNFLEMIVAESNKFANIKRSDRWKRLTTSELKIFLGLLLHMGTIKCSKVQDYWSTHRLFNFNSFSRHMSRNRFQEILRSLHFGLNTGSEDRLAKIRPIVDHFNDRMRAVYYPHKELSIDEATVPWKGKSTFGRCSAGKTIRDGVKLSALTDRSEITVRIKAYSRSESEMNGQWQATKIVLHLLDDFLGKGHSVFMDSLYASFELSEYLLDSKTHSTGTLRKLRQGNCKEVVETKVNKDEMISRYKNKIMMGKFRDKGEVLFVSSEFKADVVEVKNERGKKLRRPFVLHKYNEFLNVINKRNQILSYYTCTRKTFKWHIKVWIFIVENLLLNSFLLYSQYAPLTGKLDFSNFRLNVIDALLFETTKKNVPEIVSKPIHIPEILPRGKDNKIKRKRCRQCFAHNVRKETNYFCAACEGNPGLCLGECFREYHKHR